MYTPSRRDWAAFEPAAIPSKAHTPQLERWLASLGEPPLSCLDIGCGAGRSSQLLLARGFSVVGLDINAEAIAQLQREAPAVGAAVAGAESPLVAAGAAYAQHAAAPARYFERDVASSTGFDLDPERFDAALCQLVISVVGDAEDRAALLRNTRDVLRTGAPLFISFSGVSDDLNPEYAALYARDFPETGEPGSYLSRAVDGRVLYRTHHFTREEIERTLREQDFCQLQIEEQIESSSRRPDQRARFFYVNCRRG